MVGKQGLGEEASQPALWLPPTGVAWPTQALVQTSFILDNVSDKYLMREPVKVEKMSFSGPP